MRLLTRTTRSVSTTEAGEQLVQTIGPHVDGMETGLAALSEIRDKPAGSLRISSVEHASQTILTRALAKLLPNYPDIAVEIINDYGLTDIVADRFDAGIRLTTTHPVGASEHEAGAVASQHSIFRVV